MEITLDEAKLGDARQREALVGSCPVDIFALSDGRVVTVPEREDECILCGVCLAAAPSGAVSVRRLYGRCRPLEARLR